MIQGYRIVAPHFVAGVEVDEETGSVVRTAPIVGYMKGWKIRAVKAYTDGKQWTCDKLGDPIAKGAGSGKVSPLVTPTDSTINSRRSLRSDRLRARQTPRLADRGGSINPIETQGPVG